MEATRAGPRIDANIYNADISIEGIFQHQDIIVIRRADLKWVVSEEGKSEIYLPNYIIRYSVTSVNNYVSTFWLSTLITNLMME